MLDFKFFAICRDADNAIQRDVNLTDRATARFRLRPASPVDILIREELYLTIPACDKSMVMCSAYGNLQRYGGNFRLGLLDRCPFELGDRNCGWKPTND